MRSKDPKRKRQIIDFVDRYYNDYHCTPTTREISGNVSLSKSTVHAYLMEMSEEGQIDYDGKMIVTEAIRKQISEYNRAGIIGAIPCGQMIIEQEMFEDYVDLPIQIFGGGELYILHAYGDSMIGAGIDEGDMLVVRRQSWAKSGDLVVAFVEGEGNTLKRYFRDEKHKRFILHPENAKYPDIIVPTLTIQGVVRNIIKTV